MMPNLRAGRRDGGAVLVLALMLAAALAALCQGLLSRAAEHLARARLDVESAQAFHAAEAALTLCAAGLADRAQLPSGNPDHVPRPAEPGVNRDARSARDRLLSPMSEPVGTSFGPAGLAACRFGEYFETIDSSMPAPESIASSGGVFAIVQAIGWSASRRTRRELHAVEVPGVDRTRRLLWVDPLAD